MGLVATLVVVSLGVAVAIVASIANMALVEITWHELEDYCRQNGKDTTFDEIHDRSESAVATTEMLWIFGGLSGIVAGVAFFATQIGNSSLSILSLTVLLMVTTVFLTVWLPREIAHCWGPIFLVRTWPVWRQADRLFWPAHAWISFIRKLVRRLDGQVTEESQEEALEDEILSIVTEGKHDGLLEDDVRDMIAGVIELDDIDVADIMTPRSKIDVIPVDMSWRDMLKFVVKVGRTRIPVYEGTLDNVVGLLYVKDLLADFAADNRRERKLKEILRPIRKIPATTRLDELLQTFLRNRSHLALVVDEFTQVVGLVTIEDILEEIVGEIVDETDAEEPQAIRWLDDLSADVQGRAHVEEVNELMGIQLPESDEYDTIAGFLLHALGRIPAKGEQLTWQEVILTVQHSTKRRVESVRVSLPRKVGVK